jgi:hypothetical protein
MLKYGFIACGAALGWCGSVIINVGAPLGWLLVVAAVCCLVISYGEQQIALGWTRIDTSHD